MLKHALLYFIPSQGRDDIAEGGEFLKIQPGTGDNLLHEDIEAGYTDYVIWNRFRTGPLDIDGELEMECLDSGMMLLDPSTPAIQASAQDDTLKNVLEQAYDDRDIEATLLIKE